MKAFLLSYTYYIFTNSEKLKPISEYKLVYAETEEEAIHKLNKYSIKDEYRLLRIKNETIL